jgi:hypothetical protein
VYDERSLQDFEPPEKAKPGLHPVGRPYNETVNTLSNCLHDAGMNY